MTVAGAVFGDAVFGAADGFATVGVYAHMICTCTHTHMYIRTRTHTHTHVYSHTHTHMYIHTRTHMYIHTRTHTCICAHAHTYTHVYTVQTCSSMHAHIPAVVNRIPSLLEDIAGVACSLTIVASIFRATV